MVDNRAKRCYEQNDNSKSVGSGITARADRISNAYLRKEVIKGKEDFSDV